LEYGCVSAPPVRILSLGAAAFWGAGWSNGKMKRYILIAGCAVALSACCNHAAAALVFNDGGHHIIDYTVNTLVKVDQDTPGAGTRVDIIEGGLIQAWLDAYESSRVNIFGGRVSATVNAYGASYITVVGGEIGGPVYSRENSRLDISGGSMGAWVQSLSSSEVTISGGEIELFVEAWDNSRVTISGGTIGGRIAAIRDGLVTLVGSNFAVNGTPVGYGDFASDYATSGTLSGILANGDTLNNPFSLVHPGADITFIPEPGTILLLGLGGLGVLRKRAESVRTSGE